MNFHPLEDRETSFGEMNVRQRNRPKKLLRSRNSARKH